MRIRTVCWLLLLLLLSILLAGCSELSAVTGLLGEVAKVSEGAPEADTTPQPEQPAVVATPEPTPGAEVVVEPILFVSDRGTAGGTDIYQVNSDGSGLIRLTDDAATESQPRWSPDRKQIAFISDRSGIGQIYALVLEDLSVEQITYEPLGATSPTWSPDGRQLAFAPAGGSGDTILIADPQGSGEPNRWPVDVTGVANLAWGPAGSTIAFSAAAGGGGEGERDVFTLDLTQKLVTNLTNQPGADDYPTWAPKGDRLAFQTDRDGDENIYVMRADGSLQTPLTVDPASDLEPHWSNDGRQIAFSSDREGAFNIHVMSESGAEQRAIAPFEADDRQPRWPPAEVSAFEELAYAGGPLHGLWDLYLVSSDGAQSIQLTDNPSIDNTMPDWSPDGTRLVFASTLAGNYDIYAMEAGGSSEPIQITDNPGTDLHPVWSPDGSQIAFEGQGEEGNWEIWVIRDDGSELVNLTANRLADDGNPTWSPDGTRIAFSSNRRGNFDIYVMNSDGSGDAVRLTSSSADDFYPAWSPDGALIAFRSTSKETGRRQIYVMSSEGESLQPLLSSGSNDDSPAWSPDGQRVAFTSDRASPNKGTADAKHSIYIYDLATGRVQRVTHNESHNRYPAWRPRPAPETPQ